MKSLKRTSQLEFKGFNQRRSSKESPPQNLLDREHPHCSHCRHFKTVPNATFKPAHSKIPSEMILVAIDRPEGLNRAQLKLYTGLTYRTILKTIRQLIDEDKITYTGASLVARNARYRPFGFNR